MELLQVKPIYLSSFFGRSLDRTMRMLKMKTMVDSRGKHHFDFMAYLRSVLGGGHGVYVTAAFKALRAEFVAWVDASYRKDDLNDRSRCSVVLQSIEVLLVSGFLDVLKKNGWLKECGTLYFYDGLLVRSGRVSTAEVQRKWADPEGSHWSTVRRFLIGLGKCLGAKDSAAGQVLFFLQQNVKWEPSDVALPLLKLVGRRGDNNATLQDRALAHARGDEGKMYKAFMFATEFIRRGLHTSVWEVFDKQATI